MSNRQELELIEEGVDRPHIFSIAPAGEAGGQQITIQTQDWEAGSPVTPWRIAMHPFSSGLGPDRIRSVVTFSGELENRPTKVYAKSNGDGSNHSYFAPPMKINDLSTGIDPTHSYFNTVKALRYGGGDDETPPMGRYGGTTYMGVVSSVPQFFRAIRNFNGRAYFAGGQYLYSLNQNYTFTQVKNFGAGKSITDIEVFNSELVIAMGQEVKLWTMNTSETFTQASDATYADALGTEGEKLWRSLGNLISNCLTSPRTLTSWVPTAAAGQYEVGDSTYNVNELFNALGTIVAIKDDGIYLPDHEAKYHNQTPQLKVYPDPDNGIGSWVGWGNLFVPSVAGTLQVDLGLSIPVGPELSLRPDFRFRVRAGVEWSGAQYMICTDEAESANTFICKMTRGDSEFGNPYIYHEWLRLPSTDRGYFILVYTDPTSPTMVAGLGSVLHYWLMGRGTGIDIDDSLTQLGTSWEVESGKMIPASDLGVAFDLVGAKIIAKQIEDATISIAYDVDEQGTYTDMLDTQEGGGVAPISNKDRFVTTRYAKPNSSGNILEIKVSGTLPLNTPGTDRTEVNEVWLFGTAHPEQVDIITLGVYADRGARVRGMAQGRTAGDTHQLFRRLHKAKTIVKMKIPDYEEDRVVRVQVVDVQSSNIQVTKEGNKEVLAAVVKVVLRRMDFAEGYIS